MKTYTTLLIAILFITLNTSVFSQTVFEPGPPSDANPCGVYDKENIGNRRPINYTSLREGDVAWDDNFIYIKTSVGWKQTALSTF